MMISAFLSCSVSRALSRRSFSVSSAMGSRLDLGPRLPASRSRRHVVISDEYNPSCRNSWPMPPEPLASSASVRIRCLYSAVKRRRLAWATTSGSGWGLVSGPTMLSFDQSAQSASRCPGRGANQNTPSERRIVILCSSGGADYAKASAQELGILDCFAAFLPKPTLIIDQAVSDGRHCVHEYPLSS